MFEIVDSFDGGVFVEDTLENAIELCEDCVRSYARYGVKAHYERNGDTFTLLKGIK